MLIHELVRKELVRGTLFGVELEVEGRGLPDQGEFKQHFLVDRNEGSLRDGGLEYVQRHPSRLIPTLRKIKQLSMEIMNRGVVPVFSPRTSVHVHMNVLDMEKNAFINLYAASLIAEPLISKMCGTLREGNHFCVRGVDSHAVLDFATHMIRDNKVRHIDNNLRYGFTNLASLYKFGSLEYRGMQGTLDIKSLTDWLNVLSNLREFAEQFDKPKEMLEFLKEEGVERTFYEAGILIPKYFDGDLEARLQEAQEVLTYLLVAARKPKKPGFNPQYVFKPVKLGEEIGVPEPAGFAEIVIDPQIAVLDEEVFDIFQERLEEEPVLTEKSPVNYEIPRNYSDLLVEVAVELERGVEYIAQQFALMVFQLQNVRTAKIVKYYL